MESRGIRHDVELYNWAIKAASAPRNGRAMRAILTREGGWQAPEQGANVAGTTTASGSRDGGGGGGRGGGRPESPYFGWEAATGLLREMAAKGVPPSSITYTLVISACQKDQEPERALAVLREMQELAVAAAASPPQAEGTAEKEEDPAATAADDAAVAGEGAGGVVTPNVIHYSTVLSAFVEESGGWKRILGLIKEMEVMESFFVYVASCGGVIVWLSGFTCSLGGGNGCCCCRRCRSCCFSLEPAPTGHGSK